MLSPEESRRGASRTEPSLAVRQEAPDVLWSGNPAWAELLSSSTANPLFMSDGWQRLWWHHFGRKLAADPMMLTVRNDSGELIALAPMLRRRHRYLALLHSRQLAPIGNVWRMNVGEVTEYLDWIVRRGWEQPAAVAITRYLAAQPDWNEIIVAYSMPYSVVRTALLEEAGRSGWYVRTERNLPRYAIAMTGSFADYLRTLRSGTRRRVYNKRALLESLGPVELVQTHAANLDAQLQKLESLTRLRWGAGFSPEMRAFYQDLSAYLLERDNLSFTTLEVGGRAISALYDARIGRIAYNLRSAIDTGYHASLSPGLLHLGYVLEDLFTRSVKFYDLLAGAGKRVDYKQSICNVTDEFTSLQLVRGTLLKRLFQLYDSHRS